MLEDICMNLVSYHLLRCLDIAHTEMLIWYMLLFWQMACTVVQCFQGTHCNTVKIMSSSWHSVFPVPRRTQAFPYWPWENLWRHLPWGKVKKERRGAQILAKNWLCKFDCSVLVLLCSLPCRMPSKYVRLSWLGTHLSSASRLSPSLKHEAIILSDDNSLWPTGKENKTQLPIILKCWL